jgi:hypothetical protein
MARLRVLFWMILCFAVIYGVSVVCEKARENINAVYETKAEDAQ